MQISRPAPAMKKKALKRVKKVWKSRGEDTALTTAGATRGGEGTGPADEGPSRVVTVQKRPVRAKVILPAQRKTHRVRWLRRSIRSVLSEPAG